jgi:hypothetical protein
MSDQEINIAIAEAQGWKVSGHPELEERAATFIMPEKWIMDPAGELRFRHHIPDYCNDLNAMHEAEKVLTPTHNPCAGESQWSSYLAWLGYCGENNTSEVFQCVHATARQRAEALLRTIGKWKEARK